MKRHCLSIQEASKELLVPMPNGNLKTGSGSWDHSSLNSCDRQESNCTPCTFQKINHWIKSLEIGYVENSDNAIEQDTIFNQTDSQDNGFDIDNGMLNMYKKCDDYRKFKINKRKIKNDRLSFCYGYSDKKLQAEKTSKKIFSNDDYEDLHECRSMKQKCVDSYKTLNNEIHKHDAYESDIPLSPESEKKKELCSYLQLMKPTDKKTVMILQNRRSVRVKNLSLMHERRELEKKLKEEYKEAHHDIEENCISVFSDIKPLVNGSIEKKEHKWLKYNGSQSGSTKSCVFPSLPNFWKKTICDFDSVIRDFFVPSTMEQLALNRIEEESEFIMPSLPRNFLTEISDFDSVMGKNSQLPETLIIPQECGQENKPKEIKLKRVSTIDIKKTKYRKKLLQRKHFSTRRVPMRKTRSQLISHILHSLRNRNVSRASLKKFKNQKQIIHKEKSKKEDEDATVHNTESILKIQDDEKKIIVSENTNELHSFMPDIDFNSLSNEHQQSLLINAHTVHSTVPEPLVTFYDSSPTTSVNVKKTPEKERITFFSGSLNVQKNPSEISPQCNGPVNVDVIQNAQESTTFDLDPTPHSNADTDNDSQETLNILEEPTQIPIIEVKKDVNLKSLHRCLSTVQKKSPGNSLEQYGSPSWNGESFNNKLKKNRHSIHISQEHGNILKAFYLEYNLVLCQEFMVSFWTQTALGNVLGAQNMWIHKGSVQRMATNNNCIFKESLEMVVSTEHNVAYIELWTKEHQSEVREGPVADVFATIYFWKSGQSGLDKKVLQLENINGFADDVQYSVLKSSAKIIVSWHIACNELENKKTYVHCYQLAPDYQTVYTISDFESVEHYVSSLHSIEDCENIIAGCGENKITLWNIDRGYVVATIEMTEIKSPLCTLWVKCDRGFLFTLQQCVDRELRLIAIHGMNHSWKKLASYIPPEEYDRLKGVCVENGVIIAFYDQGVLCWNAQTAQTIFEEGSNGAEYISGKYVINVIDDRVNIRHAFTHLLCSDDS